MNVSPEGYFNNSGAETRDADEALQRLWKDGIQKSNIILDVGCGSGNVTHHMSSKMPHDRIVAIDIDSAMVEFAIKTNTDESIEYLVQDISVPFENLHEKLQQLEGQVDLIWSNRVLHWVPEERRAQTMQNLHRLARPGGRVIANITLTVDFNEFLPEAQKLENEKRIKIPSQKTQDHLWRGFFVQAGFQNYEVEFVQRSWNYGKNFGIFEPAICLMRRYLPNNLSDAEKDGVLQEFKDLYLRSLASPAGAPIVDRPEGADYVYHYGMFKIFCSK